jgi:hypothetical protein
MHATGTEKQVTYHTTILQTGNNTGIPIPEEVIEKLGSGKRPLVRVTIDQYTYRSAVAVMDSKFMISLSSENRRAAGVQGGDEVDVTVELDLEPRTVEIPEDLKTALTEASASMRKEYVRQVEEAKSMETRQRRIGKIVAKLSGN